MDVSLLVVAPTVAVDEVYQPLHLRDVGGEIAEAGELLAVPLGGAVLRVRGTSPSDHFYKKRRADLWQLGLAVSLHREEIELSVQIIIYHPLVYDYMVVQCLDCQSVLAWLQSFQL